MSPVMLIHHQLGLCLGGWGFYFEDLLLINPIVICTIMASLSGIMPDYGESIRDFCMCVGTLGSGSSSNAMHLKPLCSQITRGVVRMQI